jgi:excinuclease UvrABC nuclease subunit
MATISLEFKGYWTKRKSLPAAAGVYCVYCCVDQNEKTVQIRKLLYIGESGDMQRRVTGHPLHDGWKRHCAQGEVLCYSAAEVSLEATRHQAEAALIFKHKPPLNDEYKHSFPFETTTMLLTGRTSKLRTSFTIQTDAKD